MIRDDQQNCQRAQALNVESTMRGVAGQELWRQCNRAMALTTSGALSSADVELRFCAMAPYMLLNHTSGGERNMSG